MIGASSGNSRASIALRRAGGLRPTGGGLGRPWPPALPTRGIGVAALVAGGLCSLWIAVASAGGAYLLQLPSHSSPPWIEGPLRGLSGSFGSLGPSGVSAGLAILVATYLIALGCASSIPLRLALASVVLTNVAFALGPSLVSTDVFGYIAYARETALHGVNPYLSAPSSIPHDGILQFVFWKHQQSPYGPLFTILSAPLGLVSASAALWSFKAVACLASIAIAFAVADIARRRQINPTRAAIFVGLNPVLLFYAVSGAHNDLLAVVLLAGALMLAFRGRESAGAGAAVAAAAVKLTLGLALPFVLIGARRRGAAARGAMLAIVAIGVPTLVLFGGHFFDQLHRIVSDNQFDIAFSGPDRLAAVLGQHIGPFVRAACTAGAGLAAVLAIVAAWRGADPIAAAGWAFLALLASIASLAPWYLVWLLPLAAVARSRPLWIAALLATLYLVAVHVPALGGQPWLSAAGGVAAHARVP